jgi:hypothetical protein
MTLTFSFDDWTEYMRDVCEKKVIEHNDDQVILVCGYEGTGKSTFTIATYCDVWRKRQKQPDPRMIFYEFKEYLDTNLAAMVSKIKHLNPKYFKDCLEHYEISQEEIAKISPIEVEKGDMLIGDEAGTQFFNRGAMSGQNIKFAKLMIANRFLSLIHMLNVPKPGSIDRYVREERTRMMVMVDANYTNKWEQRVRRAYVYTKSSYLNIYTFKGWWFLFNNIPKLIKLFPPDIVVDLKGEDLRKYIPKDIQEYYDAKKVAFNISNIFDMMKDKEEKKPREKRIVDPDESPEQHAHKYGVSLMTAINDYKVEGIYAKKPRGRPKKKKD